MGEKGDIKMKVDNLIIDCHAISYAAMHSYGSFSYAGEPTGIIFGFLKMLMGYAKRFRPRRIVLCWDSEYSIRKAEYPPYKTGREKKREQWTKQDWMKMNAMIKQRTILREKIIPLLGFRNNFICDGLEADDLIAAWVKQRTKENHIIVSSDNDLYQLLTFADMFLIREKKIFTSRDLYKKFGLLPTSWAKAKAIGGCSGDTVEGIPQFGDPKTGPKSRTIKYLRGELPDGKLKRKPRSRKGRKIIKRNMRLVELPHPSFTQTIIRRRDEIYIDNAVKVFNRYRFLSLLDKLEEYGEVFHAKH